MKLFSSCRFLIAGAFAASFLVLRASAQTGNAAAASGIAAQPSAGVADIIKMLDAKVSPDVIKTYVETSSSVAAPSADDLITLKNHGATDEITVALMKHTTVASAASTSVAQSPAPSSSSNEETIALLRAYLAANRSGSGYGPESYEYFQHYYLYPRTLANVNATLGYNAAYYGFGGNPSFPYGFGPRFNTSRSGFQMFPVR